MIPVAVSKFFSALLAAVMAKEASVGASVMSGLSAIGIGWATHQLKIVSDAQAHFHDAYTSAKAESGDEFHAIAVAAQSTLTTFCADEKADMTVEIAALVSLWSSSANAAANALLS